MQAFKAAGVESAALTADLLLGHVLGWSRARVLTHPEDTLPAADAERFEALVRRRLGGEPLQYLTGEQEFYGLRFGVTPDVLIPRPETEILVDKALSLARGKAQRALRYVDVGTGSGCIAVAIAYELPGSWGVAADISPGALRVARENARRLGVLDRLRFCCGDLLEGISPSPHFDFILSNPPYVARREYNTLPKMVSEHEPHVALFSGESGLDVYRRLIPQAAARLVPGGHLLMELGLGQDEAVRQMALSEAFKVECIVEDLRGIPRCIVARKPRPRRSHG